MSAAPKAKTRLIRRGRGHSYELDGEKVPGVTTIIKNAVPMPALTGWAARTVAEYVMERLVVKDGAVFADELVEALKAYNETRGRYRERLPNGDAFSRVGLTKVLATVQYADRDAAANRGTEVHNVAHRLSHGEEVEVPEALAGHVEAYLRFLEEWAPTDALIERVVINRRWRYMGRLDLIATLPRVTLSNGEPWGGRTLLDIKTSRSGPFGDDALQLAAYRYCETMLDDDATGEVPMEAIDATGILHVRADGYDLFPFRADAETFRIFLYGKQVAEALDRDAGLVGTAKLDSVPAPVLEEASAS